MKDPTLTVKRNKSVCERVSEGDGGRAKSSLIESATF